MPVDIDHTRGILHKAAQHLFVLRFCEGFRETLLTVGCRPG
jgi:hypothetical protein